LPGAAVLIYNTGIAYEIGQFLGFANMAKVQPSAEAFVATSVPIGGEVLFNDNQVLLTPLDTGTELILTSILILSADDVMFDGNQSECRLRQRNVLFNGVVIAWSIRMTDNRFEERMLPGLSALTIAVMNCTANNQGTRCFAALGVPILLVNSPNRSLVSWTSATDPCAALQAPLQRAIQSSGFQV
jgi:hypothetical protein